MLKSLTTAGPLAPAIKRVGQGLALLGLLALLALVGASLLHAHLASAPTQRWVAPGPSTTPPPFIAAINGTIHIGGATAPALAGTNGDIHIGS